MEDTQIGKTDISAGLASAQSVGSSVIMVDPSVTLADYVDWGCPIITKSDLAGLRVEDPKEVRPALERLLAYQRRRNPGGRVTDPNVLNMPLTVTIQQAHAFALAMTKMAFTHEIEDVINTVMANWRYMQ